MTDFGRRIVDEPDAFSPDSYHITALGGKRRPAFRGRDMEQAHHSRGYVAVAAAVGGGQLNGEAFWGYRTRRSGVCGTEDTNTS